MDRRRHFILLAFLAFSFSPLKSLDYIPTQEDAQKRSHLSKSIQEPSFLSTGFSYLGSTLSYWTPNMVKNSLDTVGAGMLSMASYSSYVRGSLRYLFFSKDNQVFTQYDNIVARQHQFPHSSLSIEIIKALMEAAQNERKMWELGHMSGAVYDGSPEHANQLALFYEQALNHDVLNQPIFTNEPVAKYIARKAFKHFNTANPLHGSSFPLAVKAMREFGFMVADLFGQQHAVVSSSGQEALRLGLRALKQDLGCAKNRPCTFLAIDDQDRIARAGHSLNIGTVPISPRDITGFYAHADAAVFYLTTSNSDKLNSIVRHAQNKKYKLHVHVAKDAFFELIQHRSNSPLSALFTMAPPVVSVSFDSEGLFYNGISATIFSDATKRFLSIEGYIDWKGGIYPAINTAGSISGVDYIIAYLLILHQGPEGLKKIIEKQPQIIEKYQQKPDKIPTLIQAFDEGTSEVSLEHVLNTGSSSSAQISRRNTLENGFAQLNLHIFNAPNNFSGTSTSGGTESIRLAVQAYAERYNHNKPGKKPLFLMSETAHIAFERQIYDMDAAIIRVKNGPHKTMDVEDLRQKIQEHGAGNIAAIIASLPAYVEGAHDDIVTIASIALANKIPLHADGCLGIYVEQFVEKNPLAINLQDPRFLGITSLSADTHKYGTSQKGLAFLGFDTHVIHHIPQEICQLRSSSHLEVGLACMLTIGRKGYEQRAKNIVALSHALRDELEKLHEIEIIGKPIDDTIPHFVIAFRLKNKLKHHTYTLASFMKQLGWHLSQVSDYTLHIAITNAHVHNQHFLAKFMDDLTFCINVLHAHPNLTPSSSVGVYGMAASINGISGHNTRKKFLELMVKLYAENLMGFSS